MKLVFPCLFCVCAFLIFGQEQRYSSCYFGTRLYSKPSASSGRMDSIPFGDSVEFLRNSKKEEILLSKSGFPLKDHWVYVKYNDQKGYVFGADMAVRRVEASLFEPENPGYLGRLIEYWILDVGSIGNFASGYRLEKYADGCSDEEILLKGYSLNEVYQIMMQSYSDVTRSEFPLFNGQQETVFYFGGVGATIGISLEPLPQGQFRIVSYACD